MKNESSVFNNVGMKEINFNFLNFKGLETKQCFLN